MVLKNFFVIASLIIFFILGFVSSESCDMVGEITEGKYCDPYGELQDLLTEGQTCFNDYECLQGSCVEDFCQSKFSSLQEKQTILNNIWTFFSGEECDPALDTDYHCVGTIAYLCGTNNVWEEKGEIPGVCGVPSGSNSNSPGGSSLRSMNIIIFSPKNITYGIKTIPLQVLDSKDRAKYWKYSLNSDDEIEFTPNTTLYLEEGNYNLKISASRYSSFSSDEEKFVSFSVVENYNVLCGNNICDSGETCSNCPRDCGRCTINLGDSYCGDGNCDTDESSFSCPEDCDAKKRKNYEWLFYTFIILILAGIIFVGFLIYKKIYKKKINKPLKNIFPNPRRPPVKRRY